jgi:hypothetical protein
MGALLKDDWITKLLGYVSRYVFGMFRKKLYVDLGSALQSAQCYINPIRVSILPRTFQLNYASRECVA